jgi:ATP-dependent helicase/nuclease subunit A
MSHTHAFTPNQREALATDRHLSVTANAGSGKTTVLVNRFVDILRSTDCGITGLVAITFTEKAAGELKSRIAGRIEQDIAAMPPSIERTRLLRARDRFASAQIHTIHAFCARLLREFPVEADIDAGFTVLEDVDAAVMLDQCIREMFEDILGTPGGEESAGLLAAVRMLGGSTVERYLSKFVRSKEVVDRLNVRPGILNAGTSHEDVSRFWRDEVRSFLVARLDGPGWRESLASLLTLSTGKSAAAALESLGTWPGLSGDEEKIRFYASLREQILTGKGELRKNVSGKVDGAVIGPALRSFLEFDGEVGRIALAYATPSSHDGDLILAKVLRTLFRCCAVVLEKYERLKLEMGKLDFQDLQLKVRSLLADPVVRDEIVRRIHFIMVDEYQDTDVLQYEILKALVPAGGNPFLYVVGDPKQSIYGFRHADVRMFRRTEEDIAALNAANGTELPGAIVLPESFRLLTDNVAFVNRVFSGIMTDDEGSGGVAYDELVRGRSNDAPGGVELMVVPRQEEAETGEEDGEGPDAPGQSSSDAIQTECTMIAGRLLELRREGNVIYEPQGGVEIPVPFEFRHAAILLRGRTHLAKLESALEAAAIPYMVHGGIGYYQTQEVTDFHNYFRFLLDPGDDVALAGILRSPFFVVPDTELYSISRQESDGSFWDRARLFARSPGASAELKRAVRVLEENLLVANRLPVPILVQNIFRETGWHATMAGLAFGTQRIANVQKLVRFAREFEGKGLTNLYDVVARLTVLMRQEGKEGQASVDARQNCVNILTVHGAKGLEFPVVFLPFLHTPIRRDTAPYLDHDVGVGFAVSNPAKLDDTITPLITTYLERRARQRRVAEEKRVLYVACTRARDLLVCSGRDLPGGSSESPLSWILKACGRDPGLPLREDILLPERQVAVLLEDGTRGVIGHRLKIRVTTASGTGESLSLPLPDEPADRGSVKLAIEPITSSSRGEIFSATQIRTYMECPAKFFLKYRLGLPERLSRPSLFDETRDPDDTISGNVEGSIIHAVLQQYVEGFPSGEELRASIQRHALSLTGELTPPEEGNIDSMCRLIRSFESSGARSRITTASTLQTEFTMTSCFDDDFVTGTLDLLCHMPDGSWRIVDYKTDSVTPEAVSMRAAHYRPQLLFYALLVNRLHGAKSVGAELVFLRHPEYSMSFEFEVDELKEFEKRIRECIEKIRANKFEMEKRECEQCGYMKGRNCLIEGMRI